MDLNDLDLNINVTEFKEVQPNKSNVLDDSNVNKSLKMIMGLILNSLTPALCRQLCLKLLETVEELVKKTDTKVDDMIIGTFANKIRELLNDEENSTFITDNDEIKTMLSDKVSELSDEIDNEIKTTLNISNSSTLFDNISAELNKVKRNNPFEN